ncbi:MAG: squalene/phytoene synthase family protein [Alphaproteobacteria bacterium]
MSADAALLHCAQELRAREPDRYLVATLLPPGGRRVALALFAFDLELARIRDAVSEPMLGEIRLQFWRDTLAGVGRGARAAHPVAQAIAATTPDDGSIAAMAALVDTRARDLDDTPFADLAALSRYGADTAGGVNTLLLRALGIDDAEVVEAARAAGAGWALIGLMRALPHHAAMRRVPIPADILEGRDVDLEATFAGRATPELGRAVSDVVAEAERHLTVARRTSLPKLARPVFATVLLAVRDAQALKRANGNPFGLKPPGPLSRQLSVALGVLTGRVTG